MTPPPPVDPGPPGNLTMGTTARSTLLAGNAARAVNVAVAVREFVYDDANRMRQVELVLVIALRKTQFRHEFLILFLGNSAMKILCASILFVFFCLSSFSVKSEDASAPKIFQAGMTASIDYETRLRARKKEEDGTNLAKYALDISNYDIGMSESNDYYVIVIKLRKNEEGMEVGCATYWIEKKTMKIANAVGFK